MSRKSPRPRPPWLDTLVIALGLSLGVFLLVWPWALDWLSSAGTAGTITEVSDVAEGMDPAQREEVLLQARSYNEALVGLEPELPEDQVLPYEDQLAQGQTGGLMACWLEVPSINVSMPVYHGTSDAVLMAGVGHLEGTSLPVGGASTHCVLTAHSGMANLRMFDDIGRLEPGDLVLVHTLGETLAYSVEASEVVWPDDVSSLVPTEGADELTLVTCTPYGVNDHRLLVHCYRTDYVQEEAERQATVTERHWGRREWAVIVAVLGVAVLAVRALVRRARRRREEGAA